MPARKDIKRILVIGSGPIVIGQACEFDYSGTQAIKALAEEGFDVILANSNPATIMTDPELAKRTYVEPLTVEYLETIIATEKPQAILPTVGGQTALNLALQLADTGVLKKYDVELIGANVQAIRLAEDRRLFNTAMHDIGLEVARSLVVNNVDDAIHFAAEVHYPVIVRPSFTLGGSGGGIAYNREECEQIVRRGLELSPVHEVQIDESLLGWKEYELEVMRDHHDNVVVVCSIENFDPMGVHTGDSLTVAPAQTLTDVEYQRMRDAALAIMRKIGVDTGGSNVQFAVNPANGRLIVVEMNPRVSRSSALASKATGFPIAKIAAKLAIGYTLDEIANDITKRTPAAFEPTIDYVVTKIPKFAFEKFPGVDVTLGTQMKSVGEVMAIGRTFKESLLKALRSLENDRLFDASKLNRDELAEQLSRPTEQRLRTMLLALKSGWSIDEVSRLTQVDPWFIDQMAQIAEMELQLRGQTLDQMSDDLLRRYKENGFSDKQLARLLDEKESAVQARRTKAKIFPVYKRVDTCAGEFESFTPYLYSTYEQEDESAIEKARKVMILGSGPNRIGQGIEFDYCCTHASYALRDAGIQSIMVNCNPETVSTDYDTSDRLYFEPLTFEDVIEIWRNEQPDGVIVQFGGQTPLNLTKALDEAGVRILGTPPDSIDLAEDRQRFNSLLDKLAIRYPSHTFAMSKKEAEQAAGVMGYPLLIRPSFVLGGRAMVIVYNKNELKKLIGPAFDAAPGRPVLIDKFLENAVEFDVDALCDGQECRIAAIMQHVEQAGIHSGDSSCVLPTYTVSEEVLSQVRTWTRQMALELKVVGLMNVQFAYANGELYVLEVNPRASRTVPFVSKATGAPLAKIATQLMLGKSLRELGIKADLQVDRFFVKAPVFPFNKFPGVDPKLSPEMRSTGEVMGVADDLGTAFYKAQLGAGLRLPTRGTALITVNELDHDAVVSTARNLSELGFRLLATRGTARSLRKAGLVVEEILKQSEGRPHCVDAIKSGSVDLIINTPLGAMSFKDGWEIRTAALRHRVPCITTLAGASLAALAIASLRHDEREVIALQSLPKATH